MHSQRFFWSLVQKTKKFSHFLGGLVIKPMCDMAVANLNIGLTLSNNSSFLFLSPFPFQLGHTLGGTVGRTPQAGSSPTLESCLWQSTLTAPLLKKAFLPIFLSLKGLFRKVSWHENSKYQTDGNDKSAKDKDSKQEKWQKICILRLESQSITISSVKEKLNWISLNWKSVNARITDQLSYTCRKISKSNRWCVQLKPHMVLLW